MAGPKIIPHGMEMWPMKADVLSVAEVARMYEDGFAGAYFEPEEREAFYDEIIMAGGRVYGSDIAHDVGFADSGAGKLSIPFVFSQIIFPGALPGPGQEIGDCVVQSDKNSLMVTYACEIQWGKPDEVSGKIEEAPKISPLGLTQGAFATEPPYHHRKHRGDGWSCDAAARVTMKYAGLLPRADYTNTPLGLDLTKYSGKNAHKWGASPPPADVIEFTDDNLVRQATTCGSREELRDFIANGYAISTCGSEGFSDKRDENGVAARRGSWAHAMAFLGYDDRDSTKAIYGEALVLVQNSWAVWNSGPRDIRDSKEYVQGLMVMTGKTREQLIALDIVNAETGNIMIPKGAFWARSRDVKGRTCIAKAGVNGWHKRDLWIPMPGDTLI
jgi:hypothetical protein